MKNIISITNILGIFVISCCFQCLVYAQSQTETNTQLLLDSSQPPRSQEPIVASLEQSPSPDTG